MSKNGPILLIDDDIEDQEFTKQIIRELGMKNEVICFSECDEAFAYLITGVSTPFIILSDVNLPKMSGIDLKEMIDNNKMLRRKSIPFIFYSTSADVGTVNKAYEKRVQGYFVKGSNFAEMKDTLNLIFAYWIKCRHPNS